MYDYCYQLSSFPLFSIGAVVKCFEKMGEPLKGNFRFFFKRSRDKIFVNGIDRRDEPYAIRE